jgi:hypothetical protein
MADAILHCPKCDAGMVSFQRDGVVLEQCTDCRGVFLGEGGLTRLIESAGTPLSVVAPNGHPKPIYEGRHRRDRKTTFFPASGHPPLTPHYLLRLMARPVSH